MKAIILLIVCNVFFALMAKPQFSFIETQRNTMSLSVESQLSQAPVSFIGNQALLPYCKKPFAGIFSQNIYMMDGIDNVLIFGGLSVMNINVAALFNYTGTEFYKEQLYSLGFSKKINGKCGIGIRFNYINELAMGYMPKRFITADAGLCFRPSSEFILGIYISNPVSVAIDENLSMTDGSILNYKCGIGYDVTKQFFWGIDFSKTRGSVLDIQSLIKYKIDKHTVVKYGFSLSNYCSSLSLTFLHKKIYFMLSSSYHLKLGLASGMMLSTKESFE